MGVHNVPVPDPVLLKVALVAPRGNGGLVNELKDPQIASRPFIGVLDADAPGRAVGLTAHRLHIAPHVEKGRGHAVFPQEVGCPLSGVALGDGPQVQLHAGGKSHIPYRRTGYGLGQLLQLHRHLMIVHVLQKPGQLLLRRDPVLPGGEAPGFHHRVHSHVQCAGGGVSQFLGQGKQVGGVLTYGHGLPGGVVNVPHVAPLPGHREEPLQGVDLVGDEGEHILPLLPKDPEAHHGVHGKDGGFGHIPAGGGRTDGRCGGGLRRGGGSGCYSPGTPRQKQGQSQQRGGKSFQTRSSCRKGFL